MPTILYLFGLRFFFYSEEHLPIHVHIEQGDNDAKVEIATRKIIYNRGIKTNDMRRALEVIALFENEIIAKWHEYFDNK